MVLLFLIKKMYIEPLKNQDYCFDVNIYKVHF